MHIEFSDFHQFSAMENEEFTKFVENFDFTIQGVDIGRESIPIFDLSTSGIGRESLGILKSETSNETKKITKNNCLTPISETRNRCIFISPTTIRTVKTQEETPKQKGISECLNLTLDEQFTTNDLLNDSVFIEARYLSSSKFSGESFVIDETDPPKQLEDLEKSIEIKNLKDELIKKKLFPVSDILKSVKKIEKKTPNKIEQSQKVAENLVEIFRKSSQDESDLDIIRSSIETLRKLWESKSPERKSADFTRSSSFESFKSRNGSSSSVKLPKKGPLKATIPFGNFKKEEKENQWKLTRSKFSNITPRSSTPIKATHPMAHSTPDSARNASYIPKDSSFSKFPRRRSSFSESKLPMKSPRRSSSLKENKNGVDVEKLNKFNTENLVKNNFKSLRDISNKNNINDFKNQQ